MEGKGRELYGLGVSPNNSLVIEFEVAPVAMVWVEWCWMREHKNPMCQLTLVEAVKMGRKPLEMCRQTIRAYN